MPVANPCCGCSLRTGAQIVAIINIILSCILCIYMLLLLGIVGLGVAMINNDAIRNSDVEVSDKTSDERVAKIIILIALIVTIASLLVFIFELITSIVLLVGAIQGHLGKCRFWYIVTMIFLVLYTLKSFYEIVAGGLAGGFGVGVYKTFQFLIGFSIEAYQLWVVYAFMEELKEGGPAPTAAVYGNGPGAPPQAYFYTGHDNQPPSYSQTREGYVPVPLNNQPGYGNASAPGYPTKEYFYPKLDAEKGQNY